MEKIGELVNEIAKRVGYEGITLDIDATIIPSEKREAYYTYKGYKGYQPVNVYWKELELVVYFIAYNLFRAMQLLGMPDKWKNRRVKSIRFHVIGIAASIINKSPLQTIRDLLW